MDDLKQMQGADFWDNKQSFYQDNIDMMLIQPALTLMSLSQAHSSHTVLECGCGTGLAARLFASTFLRPGNTYVATDFSPNMVAATRQQLAEFGESEWSNVVEVDFSQTALADVEIKNDKKNVMTGEVDIMKLPFDDNTFDTIMLNSVVQFATDWSKAMSELLRVLKPGGKVAVNGPGKMKNPPIFRLVVKILMEDYPEHKDLYSSFAQPITQDDFIELSKEAGFSNIRFIETDFPT